LNYNQICKIEILEKLMKFKIMRSLLLPLLLIGLLITLYTFNTPILVQAQQPTGSVPTVTPLSTGPTGVVNTGIVQSATVRSGPSTLYDQIGLLLPGEVVKIKGKTIAGDWLCIDYPSGNNGEGWVWAYYITVSGGELPVVEIPPTPTAKYTATIDPTMAAQFVITPAATRLPTFTAPAPLTIPTYSTGVIGNGHIPVGLVILILAGLGILFGMISYIQSR
jgi:hypothetical protein